MRQKRTTLKDIAQAAGVHPSTVSRALDPNPTARKALPEDSIERIREIAARLGYRPNRLAAGLRRQKSGTVGVLIPDITNEIFPPMVRGIERVMEEAGYTAFILNTDNDPEREARLVDVLQERDVDGLIHAAVRREAPAVCAAADAGLPVVTLNRRIEGSDIPCVINDDDSGIRQMLRYLCDHGHRQIAHIAGPASLSTGRMRRDAFDAARSEMGCAMSDELVAVSERFDEAEGRRCAERLLDGPEKFTAILCANDRLALGAIEALHSRGVQCPADVSVTGFNDMPFLDRIPPGLTTVRIEQDEAGATAARLLLSAMHNGGDVPPVTVLPVKLVTRGSVARPKMVDAA